MTGSLAVDLLMGPALEVRGLSVHFEAAAGRVVAVDKVSFTVGGGEVVAVVGESGSGKSVLLKSVLGLLERAPGVVEGQVILRFRDGAESRPYEGLEHHVRRGPSRVAGQQRTVVPPRFRARVDRRLRPIRGRRVGLALQSGRSALDPMFTVGQQLVAVLDDANPASRSERATYWLERLGFDEPARVMSLYPHELSGGMAQRAMLAIVLAQEPEVLLLDEITTGLDVSLQASVLDQLGRLYAEVGFSAVLVTHDLGMARSLSSRVVIMRGGRVDSEAETEALFGRQVPLTPYAERLLHEGRDVREGPPRSAGASPRLGGPRLRADVVGKVFRGTKTHAMRAALTDVSLTAEVGQCVAFVGESGSGKTTLTRVLAGLLHPDGGRVTWGGAPLGALSAADAARLRRQRSVLFQNPYTSLNPAMTARAVIAESLVHEVGLDGSAAREEAVRRLALVGLEHRADQVVGRLSGGERRRIGLLAALQAPGEVLVLDEPTAGLDAEHRGGVRALIEAARARSPDRTTLLVSHDIGFVVQTADRVVVLYQGRVVEDGWAEDFLDPAQRHHPYTQLLWDASRYVAGATASLGRAAGRLVDPGALRGFEDRRPPVGASDRVTGCAFRSRCPVYQSDSGRWSICERVVPELVGASALRRLACHGARDVDPST